MEFYDASADKVSKSKASDTRKARLTLRHLNKLRRRRELSKLEDSQRAETLGRIYGRSSE